MDQPSKITFTQSATSLREQLIGTWDLVSNYAVRQDGSRLDSFGPNPTGRYMLDAAGHFSYMIYGSGRPKFASNNRREGTQRKTKQQSRVSSRFTEPTLWTSQRTPSLGRSSGAASRTGRDQKEKPV